MITEPDRHSPAWWDERYRAGATGWDHGIVAPEVQAYAAKHPGNGGWAIDIGCGTGTHGRELARRGYQVVGLDLSHVALQKALPAAQAEHLPWSGMQASATNISLLHRPFVMALDVGCWHNLGAAQQAAYAAGLARRLAPGGRYLLYAVHAREGGSQRGPQGVASEQTETLLRPYFELVWRQEGCQGERQADWWLWEVTCLQNTPPSPHPHLHPAPHS